MYVADCGVCPLAAPPQSKLTRGCAGRCSVLLLLKGRSSLPPKDAEYGTPAADAAFLSVFALSMALHSPRPKLAAHLTERVIVAKSRARAMTAKTVRLLYTSA